MRILITGGCGFIGHHFVEHFLKSTDFDIAIIDKLNYSGSIDRLRDIKAYDDKRVSVFTADFSKPIPENLAAELKDVSYIFHLGAETHVDNSILDPIPFVESNVLGTVYMLQFARTLKNLITFFYFSTDEVFGPAPQGVFFKEDDVHNPKNPYAAAKSAGEMFVKSYMNSYHLPCIITRTMNVFGERQHVEKFVPKVIHAALNGEKIFIHSDYTKTIPGSRMWIHARNVADAYLHLMTVGEIGETYHIVGQKEVDNLEMAKFIAAIVGKELNYELIDFHSSRPGHDLRYALDGSKIAELGWIPPLEFEVSLKKTVEWELARIQGNENSSTK